MTLVSTLQAGALGASAILGLELRWRGMAILALLASALEILLALGAIYVTVRGVPLTLVLGAVSVVCGALCWRYSTSKLAVSAATMVMIAGGARLAAWWI